MRSVRLNLWVLAPENGISNIEVSCSTVGSRAASKNLGDIGSSGFTGGSGLGMTSMMGGLGFGVGLGVGPGGADLPEGVGHLAAIRNVQDAGAENTDS